LRRRNYGGHIGRFIGVEIDQFDRIELGKLIGLKGIELLGQFD